MAAGSSGVPILDENIYRQLAGSMPAKQLHQMYQMCVRDVRERAALMRTLMAAHDAARFEREAHAIKGSCGMLGATQLHGMAAELERNGLAAVAPGAAPEVNFLDELSAACDRLERMLGSRV
jgi:HPt (histidine-containing phosphotransfer) domain-containing protein